MHGSSPSAAIRHLVVPLDGSPLAQSVLPAVARLARGLKASVTLLHVLEHRAPTRVHGERHLADRAGAEAYLAGVARASLGRGIRASWHVHDDDTGGLPRALAAHEREFGHNLVVLCTHGRGGGRRALLGSVAQRLVDAGSVPVLVLRPPGRRAAAGASFRSILLALDPHAGHGGSALGTASELARALGAVAHLVAIVPAFGLRLGRWAVTGRLLPSATAEMLDQSVEDAERLLSRRRAALERAGVRADTLVLRGDPVRALVRAATDVDADLVALSTHGRSGVRTLFTGSVASRVAALCPQPLLLVPEPRPRRRDA
jgi:nucleotide-binding universal stress UspA family protein